MENSRKTRSGLVPKAIYRRADEAEVKLRNDYSAAFSISVIMRLNDVPSALAIRVMFTKAILRVPRSTSPM